MTHWRTHDTRHAVWSHRTPRERIAVFVHRHIADVSLYAIGGFVFACLFYSMMGN